MLERISVAVSRWRDRSLSDPAVAALYFIYWQMHQHGYRFAARQRKGDVRPDWISWLELIENLNDQSLDHVLIDWFGHYQFKGVSQTIPLTFMAWLRQEWDLVLMERIPSPGEVLSLQVDGKRPVSLMTDLSRMTKPVLTKANGLAFLIHDLEHAYKFFADPTLHMGQRQLFTKLSALLRSGQLCPLLADMDFAHKFDYLISDMNSHHMHGTQYFRAILVETYLRREGKARDEVLSHDAWTDIERLVAEITPDQL